jgi:peptidyl-tRNA hydrolase, PTH1 family
MKIIVGLGNPGEKYENTRHNLGFMALDKFLKEYSLAGQDNWKKDVKFKCEIAEIEWQRQNRSKNNLEKVLLVKPITYMNLSGSAVLAIASFYKIATENIWVVHDDVDLNVGAMKIRMGGASAGHKGVESIIGSLNTDKFWRFRLGIGHPANNSKIKTQKLKMMPVDEYVLKGFGRGEAGKLKDIIKKAVKALESGLENGLDATMNKFNAK